MVNGQHVRTFLGRLLETPFPVFPSPGQQQHHQAAAAAAAAAAGGQGGGAPHHHAQQQHQQQHQEEESEEQQAALQHTLFLGMFGGYMFYHYLVNMRLLPLTKALALTQQLRRQVRRAYWGDMSALGQEDVLPPSKQGQVYGRMCTSSSSKGSCKRSKHNSSNSGPSVMDCDVYVAYWIGVHCVAGPSVHVAYVYTTDHDPLAPSHHPP
jgi:hypothetical protein